jgi:hypothetical protein
MGMDVYGLKPKTEKGAYFRNNVWYWHPLWDYCCQLSPELTSKVESGHDNSGDGLDAVDSRKLGFAVRDSVQDGSAEIYITEYYCEINALDDPPCFCTKTPQSNIAVLQDLLDSFQITSTKVMQLPDTEKVDPNPDCHTCKGSGIQPNWNKSYHINLENIQNFADFLIDCGGFQIC